MLGPDSVPTQTVLKRRSPQQVSSKAKRRSVAVYWEPETTWRSVCICSLEKLHAEIPNCASSWWTKTHKAIVDRVLGLIGTSHRLLSCFSLLNGTEHFLPEPPLILKVWRLQSAQPQSQRMLILTCIWKCMDCWLHRLPDEMRTISA